MAKDNPKKNYRYIGSSTKPEDQHFNQDYYNELVDNRQYQEAYDYAIQYPLLDPVEEAESMNELKNMLREGHVTQAVYRNIDESAYPIVDFRNAVEQPGGLERLPDNNEYANQFKQYKASIGSGQNRLRVRFEPETQKLLGMDWLRKNNTYANIDKFYEETGFNKQYLEANGVEVHLIDGVNYLEFDKSNDLANTILLHLHDGGTYGTKVQGVREDGSYTDYDRQSTVYNSDVMIGENPSNLKLMQRLYSSASRLEEKAYVDGSANVKQYSSTFVPLMYENAQTLEDQLVQGKIKDATFNSRIKRENSKLIAGIAGIGAGQYEIQSAYFNEDGEPVNRPLNQEEQTELLERYRGTKAKDIQYGISITGNMVGLTVILPPIEETNKRKAQKSARFTIFGDDIEQTLQRQINNDPGMQAYQEINDMQDLGYTYKDNNGNTYTYDGLGGWIVNGNDKSKSKEWVTRQIHKDKAAQDIGRAIVMNNVSVNGAMVDLNRYSNQIMAASVMIANDANKNGDIIEALHLIYGDRIDYTDANAITQAIFSLKGTGNRVAQEYEDIIADPAVYEKFNDVYEVCANMLNVGRRFINY